MDADAESRADEKLAMECIYSSELFTASKTADSGQFSAQVNLPHDFHVKGSPKPGLPPQSYPVEHMSPIVLNYQLSSSYPSQTAPEFTLSCKWLRPDQITKLCQQLDRIWEENQGQVILYQWASFLIESFAFLQLTNPLDLDHVVFNKTASGSPSHRSTADASDCAGASNSLCINDPRAMQDIASQEHLLPFVLEYDRCARQEVFKSQLFSCNVCMSEKLGNDCIAFVGCQHVFCADCMRRFLELHITEGNVLGLKCPTDKCESQIHQSQVRALVSAELFSRYDRLLLQLSLDQMSDIIYCPRKMCGAAVLLDSDSQMAECSVCRYVFCKLCRAVYHGVNNCAMNPEQRDAIVKQYSYGTEEEKALLIRRYGRPLLEACSADQYTREWIEQNSKKCPSCNTPIQKIDGCNKMACLRCHCYFCWLCMAILPKGNPYSHFRDSTGKCNNRLFEGMLVPDEDNEDDVDDDEEEEF